MKRLQIAVIGSAGPEEYPFVEPQADMFAVAEAIGARLAQNNCIVVNGGKGGVMEAVCRGAKAQGGMTVAEIAGNGRGEGNEFVDVEIITTDTGYRGPSLLIGMSDAVLALGGGAGTLQELAVAYRMKKPVVLLKGYGGWTDRITGTWLDERRLVRFYSTKSIERAVSSVISKAREARNENTKLATNR